MRPTTWTRTSNCGTSVAADLRSRVPSVRMCSNWRRRRMLPRDGWLSDSCQSQRRKSLPEGDRSAHVERVEPSSEGPMLALWEARVVTVVSKADLALALAQNFNKGCRRARADLRYEEPQSERCAGGVSTGRSIGGTARTWRYGSRPPLPRYTRMQADFGLYSDLHLYYMWVLGGLSLSLNLSQHSQLGALMPKLTFLSALLARSNATALGAHQESASSPITVRNGYACGAFDLTPNLVLVAIRIHLTGQNQ